MFDPFGCRLRNGRVCGSVVLDGRRGRITQEHLGLELAHTTVTHTGAVKMPAVYLLFFFFFTYTHGSRASRGWTASQANKASAKTCPATNDRLAGLRRRYLSDISSEKARMVRPPDKA